jgi:signal transduction histidine kinase/DNA-binding response OmpR family regulator
MTPDTVLASQNASTAAAAASHGALPGSNPCDFLAGGGDMGVLMRSMDWSATGLGPVETWPQSLRTSVSTCLNSRFPILIWWGPELIKIYNDAYRPILGGKHPRSMGQRGRDCWPEIWHIIGPMLQGVLERGEATWSENQLLLLERHGFPEECYFTFSYSPIRDETGIAGVFCAVTETTGQVLGERRLRTLRNLAARAGAGNAEQEAWQSTIEELRADPEDLPFALLYRADAGQGLVRLVGAAGLEAGSNAAPLTVELSSGERSAWSIAQVASSGLAQQAGEALVLPVARAGGSPYGVLVAGLSPRRPLDEGYRGFLALVADHVASVIANARAYEEEKRRAEALASLDRAKTAFFSNVSHEFRTPLTLMLGPVEDALSDVEQPLSASQRERLELIRRSGLRLQKLVNSLLDFSRIEAGRAQASYVPTDLAVLTAELASSFRSAIEKAGLKLSIDCPPLAELAYVDRDMWEKLVLNLLSNALKFTFEGEIEVSLRQNGERIALAVRDSGTGIAAAELPHVFERFRRIEGARSRTHEGTGIGLALVQELVKLHGGEIGVESVEGQGSTFTVSIPCGKAHLPAERIGGEQTLASTAAGAEPYVEEALRWLPGPGSPPVMLPDHEPAPRRFASPAQPATPERIVWADDNADMREYVRRLLSTRYEVIAVADGEAALAAVRAHRPDLVLADVMMPKLDGLGLVRALRAQPDTRALPVILLSARAGEDSRIEGMDAGADDYLHKPFTARELLARISARLELGQLQSRLEQERTTLASLFAQTPVPTAVLKGPELVFEMANPAYLAVVRGRDIVGRPLLEALPEIEGQGFDALLRDVIRTGNPYVGREALVTIERDDRLQDSYWTFIYAPLRGPHGRIDSVIAICSEVTEQVLARERMRDADRRKDEFLATLSHELRNPLAPLSNSLHLLRAAGSTDGAMAAIHEMMDRQVNHLVRLVDDLLEMSRISRGAFDLRKERVEMAVIVRHAIETSTPLVESAGHRLIVSLPEEPLWLDGDPVRLAQILANLLNNAAKYTGSGGQICVHAERQDGTAAVSVRDNGDGIDPDTLPQLFEMFSRGGRSSVRGQGGLGIGLALARRLVEMHGGSIEARSEGPGRGSEFTVRLPLAVPPVSPAVVEPPVRAAIPGNRILVVDDNRDAAESLGLILQSLGAEVRVARDGAEALETFGSYHPAVVLLDIGMPGMDGYEVARRIRARFPERRTALVALTGWGQEQDRRHAREAGFDHHLVKPADMDALQALLASLPAH